MIHSFNSIYSYTQPLPSVLLELCLPNCSWIKCTEAINLKWKTDSVSSKYIWHHAQEPTKELCLSLSIRNCFSSTTSSFLPCGPWIFPFPLSLVKSTWRFVASNLSHSLTPSSIYFLHLVFPLPHIPCLFLSIFLCHIIWILSRCLWNKVANDWFFNQNEKLH